MPSVMRDFLAKRARLPGEAAARSDYGEAAPTAIANASDAVRRLAEKVRTATLGGQVSFLPYLDPYTRETAAMMRHYPLLMANPVIKQAVQHKVHSVAALDLQVTPAAETARDHEIADAVRYCYADAMEGGFVALCEDVLFPLLIFKSCIAEKVWQAQLWPRGRLAGKRFYRRFKPKETVEAVYDEFRNVIGVRATGFGQTETFDPRDFVIMKNLALFDGPGMSDLRAAYWYIWQLDTIEKLHNLHLERYVTPITHATYAAGFNTEHLPALEEDLTGLRSRSWLITPEAVKLTALQLATRGEAEFLEKCKDLREQATLSVTGAYLQMLTATSGGDIRGNAQVQQGTAELLVWELAARLAGVLNTQATPSFVDENYLGADYPKVSLGGINYAELLNGIKIDQVAQTMGAELSARAFARKYNLQLASDPNDKLVPLPAAPPAGPPGGPGGGPPGGGIFADPEGKRVFQPGPGANPGPSPVSAGATAAGATGSAAFADDAGRPTDPPDGPAAPAEQVALAGPDGKQIVALLASAEANGAAILQRMTARAVGRLLAAAQADPTRRPGRLFTPRERRQLAAALAASTATAELLGRARIRRRADHAEAAKGPATFADADGKPRRFSECPTDLRCFDETGVGPAGRAALGEIFTPRAAVEYFAARVPGLDLDAGAIGQAAARRGLELAVSADQVLLQKVHGIIAERLQTGANIASAPDEITGVLEAAGVAPANPAYGRTVFRTAMMDSYNGGSATELMAAAETFPVWRYLNPDDARSRPTHAARNGLYYASDRDFADVRGRGPEDVCNDRCSFAPIDKWEWADLQAAGAQVES